MTEEVVLGNGYLILIDSKIKWEKWFAWRPVQVHNKWTWLKTVYRYRHETYSMKGDRGEWRYGTILDVLMSN